MKPPPKPYNFHPACLAFPLLPDAALQELAEDVKLRGLLHPVVVFQGQVLDGRNRLAACETAGTTDVAAKLDAAMRAMMVVRVLVSISVASCGELVCKTILAPNRVAG